ncbi:MAG: EamA family transporter [Bacteroidales bacterium]|nr:EamA family transporter [Clostridium sp.]MCM1202898.1 EamA family transporter [Bacteroidales bacterium]
MNYIALFIFSVFVSSVSQTMLKSSADRKYDNPVKEYLNPIVITAYAFFFGSTVMTTLAYKYVPLSLGPVIEASGYFFVAALGYIFLKERFSRRKVLGLFVILLGIIVFNIK